LIGEFGILGIPFNPFNKGIPGIKPINHQLTQDLIRGSQDLIRGSLSNHYLKPKPTNEPLIRIIKTHPSY